MKRSELEHLIRAAGTIADDTEIIIVGSQSILGQFPDAPQSLLVSAEADLFPQNHPERADLIDGSIGEGSQFHEEFGYYAQGVDERTATLPRAWRSRLVRISNPNTRGIAGLCLEVHDLPISKYVAGREKDLDFTRELARHEMTRFAMLNERLAETNVSNEVRPIVAARIRRDFPGQPKSRSRRGLNRSLLFRPLRTCGVARRGDRIASAVRPTDLDQVRSIGRIFRVTPQCDIYGELPPLPHGEA